jgi:hypothetical protein
MTMAVARRGAVEPQLDQDQRTPWLPEEPSEPRILL